MGNEVALAPRCGWPILQKTMLDLSYRTHLDLHYRLKLHDSTAYLMHTFEMFCYT